MFRRTALLAVVFAAAGIASAAEKPYGIAVGAGLAAPKDVDTNPTYFSIGVRYRLGDNVALEPEIGYSRSDTNISYGPAGIGTGYVRDISMGATLMFRPEIAKGLHLVLGVGGGAHGLRGKVAITGFTIEQAAVKAAAHGLGGIDVDLGKRWQLFAYGRYDLVAKWQEMYDLDMSGPRAYGGFRFRY